jgi:hypothetical protein
VAKTKSKRIVFWSVGWLFWSAGMNEKDSSAVDCATYKEKKIKGTPRRKALSLYPFGDTNLQKATKEIGLMFKTRTMSNHYPSSSLHLWTSKNFSPKKE